MRVRVSLSHESWLMIEYCLPRPVVSALSAAGDILSSDCSLLAVGDI